MKRHDKTHDYTDTVKQAAGLEETDHEQLQNEGRARKNDRELAYALLAVNSSMGMLGMEDEAANLIRLEFASELMYGINNTDGNDSDPAEDL